MFSKTKYRKDIQVLRGLAVLAVVLFHADESYFPLGYLGVDIFFVISGFVVTPLILRIFTDQASGGWISNLFLQEAVLSTSTRFSSNAYYLSDSNFII
jgi:peptidoglycan/LPS O-acetylase OafA/YrhL